MTTLLNRLGLDLCLRIALVRLRIALMRWRLRSDERYLHDLERGGFMRRHSDARWALHLVQARRDIDDQVADLNALRKAGAL